MYWLPITIFAYFLNAIAVTVDKFLLTKKIPNPAVYTFFIAALSLLALVLVPFGFELHSWPQIAIAMAAGIIFTLALLFMFKALGKNEASRVTPFMGGLQPLFVFILALIFLGEILSYQAMIAFSVIILGTVVISSQKPEEGKKKNIYLSYVFATISTLLFAISYTISKYVFIQQDFISGFVWTRVGAFLGALFLLLSVKNRQDIMKEIRQPKQSSTGLFLFGQAAGAASFILVNYAISISDSVALVNALRGTEYVFLLILVTAISHRRPKIFKEKTDTMALTQKIIATALIIIGLFLLFYQ